VAISAQDIYEGKVAQFGMSASHKIFLADFIRALKASAAELANDLDADVITISNAEDDLDYPVYAQAALESALDYWLVRYGHKSGDLDIKTALDLYDNTRRELRLYILAAAKRALSADDGAGQIGLTS